MQAYYRNKTTGEVKLVEQDSAEMFELQREVAQDGYPKWEQTSPAHADTLKERANAGQLRAEDLGKEHAAELKGTDPTLSLEGVGPEAAPWRSLTPGEIEAGLTPDQKESDLNDMFGVDEDARGNVFAEAAKKIGDGKPKEGAKQQAKGLRARAGGSDERDDVPRAKAKDSTKATAGSSGGGSGVGQEASLGDNPTRAK